MRFGVFATVTQKRNNQEYDQQEADYQHNLTEWRNSHRKIPNPDGVAASDIKQSFTLNREPDAVVSAPGLIPYTIGYTGDNNGNSALGVDSKTGISFSKDTTVTFTNLKNSFYQILFTMISKVTKLTFQKLLQNSMTYKLILIKALLTLMFIQIPQMGSGIVGLIV